MSTNNRKKIILLTLIILFCSCCLSTVYASFNPKNISVGVLAFRGPDLAIKRWTPTIQYLNQQLPEYHFSLVPKNLDQLTDLTKEQDIDFILTNTGHYVLLESLYGVTRLATLRNLRQGKALDDFGSVIFTKADRADINTLNDFVGKSFMGVSKKGFGGFQVAWREFKHAGVDPFTDFSRLSFSGFPQDAIVHAVLRGDIDGGTMRTDSLERLAGKGQINIDEIKIINAQQPEGFPFLISSELYPEWPFSKAKHVPLEVAKKVVIALLQIQRTSTPAVKGKYSEWTVPSDYQPVHELMKDLKIGSYAEDDQFDLKSAIKTYWKELVILALVFIVLIYLFMLISRRNKALLNNQEATKSKFKFLANVSRETESFMDSLISQGKQIDNEQTSSKQDNYLNKMLDSSATVSSFFHDIHDFSKIESGNAQLEMTKFNLMAVLDDIDKQLKDKLAEKKISLSISTGDKVPNLLVGDPERLEQIILNIMNIAMKFTHKGTISLSVDTLKSSTNKANLKFEISDSGMILNQGQIDMLFNSFVHSDTLSIQNYGGASLGLYISRKFIELMGGKTWVEGGEGKGGLFGFSSQFDAP